MLDPNEPIVQVQRALMTIPDYDLEAYQTDGMGGPITIRTDMCVLKDQKRLGHAKPFLCTYDPSKRRFIEPQTLRKIPNADKFYKKFKGYPVQIHQIPEVLKNFIDREAGFN